MEVGIVVNLGQQVMIGIVLVLAPILIAVGWSGLVPVMHRRKHGHWTSEDSKMMADRFTESTLRKLMVASMTVGFAWAFAWGCMWFALWVTGLFV